MPRKSASEGPSKSELIRKYKADKPTLGPTEIAALLKSEHSMVVSAQFVSTVLSQAKKKAGKGGTGRRGRPPGSGKKAAAAAATTTTTAAAKPAAKSSGLSVDAILKAKKLAKEFGSVEEAKAALDALAQIVG